ncbi:MAG: hypothetical protein IJK85_09950 [Bacteroidales bacterium]|nr:hypothetical protein [Bacteroidales bacterium]
MKQDNRKRALLIAGNGIDVAMGYHTRYGDFYKEYEENIRQAAAKGNDLCKSIVECEKHELWADLEHGLYVYSQNLSKEFGIRNIAVAQKFKSDFVELKSLLFDYLKEENKCNRRLKQGEGRLVNELLQEWKRFDLSIISFNYTNFIELHLSPCNAFYPDDEFDRDNNITLLHGSLSNKNVNILNSQEDIVVGIDDSQVVDSSHNFLYKSVQRRMNARVYIDAIRDSGVIIVYGCSMGESDHFYFSKLFEKEVKDKHFLIYGYKNDGINSLYEKIQNYSQNLSEFQSNQKSFSCIDSSNEVSLAITHKMVEQILSNVVF